MMKKIILFAFAFVTLHAQAQKKSKPEPYAQTITTQDLKKHLFILAGPEMEGRETATPGQKKAAAYIESQFKAIGLQPGNGNSYQMNFPVYQDSLVSASLEVNGQAFQPDKDFNPIVNTNNTSTLRFSEVVVVRDNGALDSIKKMNLTGRLVLLTSNLKQERWQSNPLFSTLISKGVGAILLVEKNYPRNASRTGNQMISLFKRSVSPQQYTISEAVYSSIVAPTMPSVTDILANAADVDRKNVADQIKIYQANILLETVKTSLKLESSNVIGVLPGTDLKDQYLFITAHYDHLGKRGDSVIYYGADDDGSGTVGIIEIAEAFAKAKAAGHGPRRTIVFMAVSGEEKGLWGSAYYTSNPIFPLEKTTANLNIDMIGRSDTERKGDTINYVYIVGDDKLSSDLRPISEAANKKINLELDYKFNDPKDPHRIYFRSDHYNFAKNGVPIIFYYDGMLKADYHKPTDTPDKINYPLLAKRAQLVFYTAWEMANRNDMLKRDIPLNR